MKKMSSSDIINTYINCGITAYESVQTGNYRKRNKQYFKLLKLYKYLEENIDIAKVILPQLFEHENVAVRFVACMHCLRLKIHISEAERIIKEIMKNEKNGIYCLEAEMALKAWEEGKLNIVYSKDKK